MSDADQALTLTILKDIRADIKDARADTRKLQELLLASIEADRRRFDAIDRRFDAVDRRFEATDGLIKITAADLEIMLKGELLGRLTHFETKIDDKIEELEDRMRTKPSL